MVKVMKATQARKESRGRQTMAKKGSVLPRHVVKTGMRFGAKVCVRKTKEWKWLGTFDTPEAASARVAVFLKEQGDEPTREYTSRRREVSSKMAILLETFQNHIQFDFQRALEHVSTDAYAYMGVLNLPWSESKSEIFRQNLVSLWAKQPLSNKLCILAFHPAQQAAHACFDLLIACSKATADARATHKRVRDVEMWENENVHRSLKARHGEGPFLRWAKVIAKGKASEAGAWQIACDPDAGDAWWKAVIFKRTHVTFFQSVTYVLAETPGPGDAKQFGSVL